MEVTEAQIARLVLGYLKKECDTAYKGFLKNSKHIPKNAEKDKYFVTRIFGLSLVEIVREYVDIYYTIQGRLEATSYFSEINKNELARNKLIDQLLFLLNKIEYSRSSTPCSIRSPIPEEHEDDSETITVESHVKRTSKVHASQKTPPEKQPPKTTTSPENILAENEEISEVLTQQLLKNHELHEKLAETINNVLNSPEKPLEDANKSGMQEAIKTVVERTEADPIFEKLIEEIMGVTNERMDDEQPLVTPPPIDLSPLKPTTPEAKRIVDNQKNEPSHKTAPNSTDTNNEVIVFDGTLDNYLKSTNTCAPNTTQNPLFVNTGLLMVQPSTNYLVVNSQPLVNVPPTIEHDILSMPTVIVSDGKNPTNTGSKTRRPTKPKSTSTAADFLTSFSTNLLDQSKQKLPTFIQPTKFPIVTSTSVLSAEKPPPPPPPLPSGPMSSPPPLAIREPLKLIESKETKEKQTPCTSTESVQRVTPKSASHVRNLDFSTPPKITSTVRKLKRDEQTSAVKTLFKSNNIETQMNPTDKPKQIPIKKKTSWDEDLRQMIGSVDVEEKRVCTPKKKKLTPKTKRLVAKKKRKLNVTAVEAKLLEAALKTPIKNDVVSQEDVVLNEFNKSDDSPHSKKLDKCDKELDTSGTKTILSPSKLNVNKRTLVKSATSTPELVIAISPCNSMKDSTGTPLLKTPLKQQQEVPKTPGLDVSVHSNFTPFTKVIDEHLNGVDLDLIQTPSFPITPNFPTFTPSGSNLISPYSNRPTDYSTSSSYYQPSDTEQNRSLEQMMIDECNRLENKPKTPQKVTVISDVTVPPLKSVVNEQMREFNKNIIGKKNLKLLKCDDSTSSSSSSSSSDSSSDSSVHNDTVICKKSTRISRIKDQTTDIRDIIKTVEIKETLNKPSMDKQKLLNDLKEKRERVKQKCKPKPCADQKKPVRRSKRRVRDQKGKYHAAETKTKSPADRITSEEEFTLRLSSDDETSTKNDGKSKEFKSPSDLEAENLITNLKERGIHLVHNKSPKKMLKEDANELIQGEKLVKVYDTRTYEQEDVHVVHDEKKRPSMKFSDYDLSVLNRELSANVYVEAFDIEVMIPIKVSPFSLLLDLSPKLTMKTRSRTEIEKKCTGKHVIVTDEESNSKEVDDDLMNFAIVGNVSEAGPPSTVASSPRTSKKRKGASEDAHIEKKSKTENCVGILKGIDVDDFLNNIHGSH